MNDKVLLVEGKDDKFVIAELMKSYGLKFLAAKDIDWIKPSNGYENLAKEEALLHE